MAMFHDRAAVVRHAADVPQSIFEHPFPVSIVVFLRQHTKRGVNHARRCPQARIANRHILRQTRLQVVQ